MIPAHIDKEANSLLYNLGFIPPDSRFKVVEVKKKESLATLLENNKYLNGCKIIHNSDAHYLQDIHEVTEYLEVKERSIKGVLDAFVGV